MRFTPLHVPQVTLLTMAINLIGAQAPPAIPPPAPAAGEDQGSFSLVLGLGFR